MTLRDDRRRVLVIQDVEEIRRAFRDELEATGYDVTTAEDESCGLEAARRHRPDLVIVCLPQQPLDAIQAGLRLREHSLSGEEVPLVIIPGTRTDLEDLDVPLGRNVYVSFLGSFDQLDRLLAGVQGRT